MILLFGLAGSGKGTQGNALAELFGWRWISSGQLIRNSGKFEHIIKDGNIVSDEETEEILTKEFEKNETEGFNIILEGFPRNKAQTEWLLSQENIDLALVLDVPKEELYERLELRAETEGRSDDQEKSSIDHRFEIFEQNICSILPLLESHNVPVVHANGVGKVEEVTDRLVEVVKKFVQSAQIQEHDVNNPGENERSYGE